MTTSKLLGPADFASALLRWYDAHARSLPWRAPPGRTAPEPYRVWLSEIMLQQTTAAAVGPYFDRFAARWPTVLDLAAAEDGEVMSAWAGLGYYARARNLLACARALAAAGGTFPDTEEGLRALPGLGPYTAAAVAAIAFGRRAVVVDANVERVVARQFAVEQPLPGARARIRELSERLTPDERAGDFAQAMMDLGATVCTPRAPGCLLCPVAASCAARAEGRPDRFPVKAARRARPMRRGAAFWIERQGAVWLVRREGRGMLGGMLALPDDGWSARGDGSGEPPIAAEWTTAGQVAHVFSHFELNLAVARTRIDAGNPLPAGQWWPIAQLATAGFPTLFEKAARLVLAEKD